MFKNERPNSTTRRLPDAQPPCIEWPTVILFVSCYAVLGISVFLLPAISMVVAILCATTALALHCSLTHEIVHGHPLPSRRASEALALVNPALLIPFYRFRDTHLAHHQDARLTDPYDDPESNYMAPDDWARLPGVLRVIYRANNTLCGRILIGPLLGQVTFMADDLKRIRAGDRNVLAAWLWHVPGVILTLAIVSVSPMPVWAYLVAVYAAHGVIRIRTFLEHQAHEKANARTVIIEDRGPLAFLFLNNNLHVVHHMHPRVPWYRLPALYTANKARYVARNDGYVFSSYGQIFRTYFLRSKDPVPHPLWPSR